MVSWHDVQFLVANGRTKLGDVAVPEHILSDGKQVIAGLCILGEALGYHVVRELPVRRQLSNPPAVDVAWFSDREHDFPLMIFEVETRSTTGVASNATKVFGQSNQEFEKPLFFFHIIVRGGQDTTRLDAARTAFGTHNYRHYRLGLGERTTLVRDVLSQHRRLTNRIDFVSVVLALKHESWQGVDLSAVLLYAEGLRIEGSKLPSYSMLAKEYPEFQEHFLRYLQMRYTDSSYRSERDRYSTYLGMQWAEPIHLGLMVAADPGDSRDYYFELLRHWQERSTLLPMIGPVFGQNRDYDRFVMGLACPLWGLIAALMHDLPEAGRYVARQCKHILVEMERCSIPEAISFHVAHWMLVIAASSKLARAEFEYARIHINNRGGFPANLFYRPLGVLEIDEPIAWLNGPLEERVTIPNMIDYKKGYQESALQYPGVISLGISALREEMVWASWSSEIVAYLLGER